MSYYRRADGSQPSAPSAVVPAQPSAQIVPALRDASDLPSVLSPDATSQPLAMPAQRSTTRRRVPAAARVLVSDEDLNAYAEAYCNFRPFGACRRLQSPGSVYCAMHTCQAVNVDHSRCANLVKAPNTTRICSTGYHHDNARYAHVEKALKVQRDHALNESTNKARELAAAGEFFHIHFSSAISNSESSSSSQFSDESLGRRRMSLDQMQCPVQVRHPELTRRYGYKEIDKWWIGQWRELTSESSPISGLDGLFRPRGASQ